MRSNYFLIHLSQSFSLFFLISNLSGPLFSNTAVDEYQKRLWQLERRDVLALEELDYDGSYKNFVGVQSFRKHLFEAAHKAFQDDIPLVLRTLRKRREKLESKRAEIDQKMERLGGKSLRAVANTYVVEFLQIVEQLISGTSEGVLD